MFIHDEHIKDVFSPLRRGEELWNFAGFLLELRGLGLATQLIFEICKEKEPKPLGVASPLRWAAQIPWKQI